VGLSSPSEERERIAQQVLDYQDAILYATDVRLITPPNWLNDNCINVYLRLLEHEDFADRRDLLFMDPAVVSCMMIQCTGAVSLSWCWRCSSL
jgi:hypothetical protein